MARPHKLYAVLTVIATMVAALIGCNNNPSNSYGGSSSGSPPPPNTVVMSGYSFSPSSMTIKKGTTITWKNNDGAIHTSTSDSGVWDTGDMPNGASKTTTFNTVGTFNYHCTYHQAMGMTGTITVQ
ncbi:MAG TPA: plastocyanin/azurin family copper-binding protein [Bacteroidota bacterium]|nr:plastocyanin/azurin family copper-binding protein [Bacteroidota bacterium]